MFQDGLHVVVKQDCPTCAMIEPAIRELASRGALTIYVQDDPFFLNDIGGRIDDANLEYSKKVTDLVLD